MATAVYTGLQVAATYTCKTTGALNFSAAASVQGDGDATAGWVNPTYALTTESPTPLYAVSTIPKGNKKSFYLQVSNLGLVVSPHKVVTGIQVSVTRKAQVAAAIKDNLAKLIKADGTFGATNKADTGTSWLLTDFTKSYGGEGDTWGETITGADLNDTDFGFIIQVKNSSLGANSTASVELITMTIWFTDGTRMTVTKTMGVN